MGAGKWEGTAQKLGRRGQNFGGGGPKMEGGVLKNGGTLKGEEGAQIWWWEPQKYGGGKIGVVPKRRGSP